MYFTLRKLVMLAAALPLGLVGVHAAPLRVTVSIPPQKYFVERVAGDLAEVTVMVGPGESPAVYEPKPSQLTGLASADVYFTVGVPYERTWLARFQGVHAGLNMVDTTAGLDLLASPQCVGAGGEHHHPGGHDPHVWLSPRRVEKQAAIICASLSALAPEHGDRFAANLGAFVQDLQALDRSISNELQHLEKRTLLVFHPVWTYYAHDYGLELIPVEVGGQEPSSRELANILRLAREKGATVILAQPEFSTRAAHVIASQVGGRVILLSPLAEDWMANMKAATSAIKDALWNGVVE